MSLGLVLGIVSMTHQFTTCQRVLFTAELADSRTLLPNVCIVICFNYFVCATVCLLTPEHMFRGITIITLHPKV